MGFCSKKEHDRFLKLCPEIEKYFIETGMIMIKFWLEVGNDEQERRFRARVEDPLRQWKLSPMDLPSRERWYDYSRARDMMLDATDTEESPWYIIPSDDKKRARLNCISHLLNLIPWESVRREKDQTAQALQQRRIRRSGLTQGQKICARKILNVLHLAMVLASARRAG